MGKVARRRQRVAGALLALAILGGRVAPAHAEPGAAAALSPTSWAVPSGPASVRGLADAASLDVFTGQARYAIPIDLPVAAAGFAPSLALQYDGALGSGPLGLGWHLGVPRIQRSLRHGVPSFTDGDELDLLEVAGGGRLVQVAPNAYRLEGAGERVRVVGGPADGFVVDDGTGRRYRFGEAAREGPAGRVVAWLLESIEDSGRGRAAYTYGSDAGTAYLTTVAWGEGGQLRAELTYAARPDAVTSLRGGSLQRLGRRLTGIEVRVAGQLRARYELAYDDGAALARLAEVRMLGRDGRSAMPPVRLGYTGHDAPHVFELQDTRGWRLGARGCMLLDVDGDGIADFFQSETGRFRRGLGDGLDGTCQTRGMLAARPAASRFIDLDGDGRVEQVLQGSGDGWRVARLDLETLAWQRPEIWPGTRGLPLAHPSVALVDLDGDGLPDLVRQGEHTLTVYMGSRAGLGARREVASPNSARARIGGGRERWADANGDGLADLFALDDASVHVLLGRGDGTFLDGGRFPYPWNGDVTDPSRIVFADLDRDGLADLVSTSHGHVTWYTGRAAGGWAPAGQHLPPPTSSTSQVALGDVDGNGSLDIVWPSGWVADVAGACHAGMLASIDNGMGAVTHFAYRSSTAAMVEAERRERPWQHRMPAAVAVVSRIEQRVAGGATETTLLDVRDAVWDAEERRFAGFLTSERTAVGDASTPSLVETTTFYAGRGEARVLRGQAATKLLRGAAPLRRQQWTWQAAPPPALASGHPLLRLPLLVREQTWLLDAADPGPPEMCTDYVHDAAGNVVRTHAHGQVGVAGDESIHEQQFADSDAPWVRGVRIAAQLRDGEGRLLTAERSSYDGAAMPLPHGELTRGWLRQREGWLAAEDRWVTLSRLDYDDYGNVVAAREHGRARTLRFDAAGIRPVRETLDVGARTLAWEMQWDDVLGVPLRLVGPDGAPETISYDALGRPVARAHDGAPPHACYAYDWRAPLPRTTTTLYDGAAGERRRTDVADGLGRPLYGLVELARGQLLVEGWQRYGARGTAALAALPFTAATEEAARTPGADAATQAFVYDALGRNVEMRMSTGAARRVRFAGLSTTVTETDLAPVSYLRDGAGRLRRTARHVPGSAEVADADYDAAGRLVALRLQGGAVTYTVRFDSLGRHVCSHDPDSGTRHYTWDDADRLTAVLDAAGTRAGYVYDAAGRLVRRDGGGGGPTHYHYDVPQQADARHTMGRLAWTEDPAGTTHFSYDSAGRPERVVRSVAGHTAHRTLRHSPAGLLLATDTDGTQLAYRYDGGGRLVGIDGLWEADALSPSGAVLEETYGNGARQRYVRDALQQPLASTLTHGARTLLDLRAAYTALGLLQRVDDADGVGRDHSASYRYDAAARLVHAELGSYVFDYAYDALQNLTARDVEGPRVLDVASGAYAHAAPGRPRQISTAGGTPHAYDAAGRMTADGRARMAYDALGRLVQVTLTDGREVAHTYGYDGERALTDGPAGRERQFFADLSETPEGREQRVAVGERTVARIITPAGGGAAARRIFHHATFSDGATLLTDAAGQVVDERLYDPFGADIAVAPGADGHGRADKHRDAATGWVDHGARWASPRLASWLSPDPPTLLPDGSAMLAPWDLHPYQYLRQNPTTFRDADGRFVQVIGMVAAGAAFGVGVHVIEQTIMGEPITWSSVGVAAATGGAGAGVGAALGGAKLLAIMASGAASGATSGAVGRELTGEDHTAPAVAHDAAVGSLTAGLARPLSRVVAGYWRSATSARAVGSRLFATAKLNRRWNKILADSIPGNRTRGPTKQYIKSGGMKQASDDYKDLSRGFAPKVVKTPRGDTITVCDLGRGVKSILRASSGSGAPTLEIQHGPLYVKVRYAD